MTRCLELAAHGLGYASPNPLVGSVIVHEGRIIGEGFHTQYGGHHAEVEALNSCQQKELLPHSTLYVNLEPCAHQGKTPACAPQVVEAGIPRVVIANRDPFHKVDGRGIQILKDAGVDVLAGVMAEEARWLNRRFFTALEQNRPYIILKWAKTQDGFIDRDRGSARGINWITHPNTQLLTHRWRAEEDAILVGTQTILNDDPELTVRATEGRQPIRLVLGRRPIPNGSKVLNDLATTRLLQEIELDQLVEHGIHSLIVEGGRQTHESFIKLGAWDEARIMTGEVEFGSGLPAPSSPGRLIERRAFGVDTLEIRRR